VAESLSDWNQELNIETLIGHAHELADCVKKYRVERAVIGLHLEARYPEGYTGYISVSQMIYGK
jgi:hypothetical protein